MKANPRSTRRSSLRLRRCREAAASSSSAPASPPAPRSPRPRCSAARRSAGGRRRGRAPARRRRGLPAHRPRAALLRNHAHLSGGGTTMLLTRKPSSSRGRRSGSLRRSALVASLARGVRRAVPTMDRRAFLRRSGPRRRRRPRDLAAHAGQEGRGRRCRPRRRQADRRPAHRVLALLGRLRGRRGGRERRLGPPGAGVRFADQPRRALRQGRGAARARPRRIPPEVRR